MKNDIMYEAWDVGPVGYIPWTFIRSLYLSLPNSGDCFYSLCLKNIIRVCKTPLEENVEVVKIITLYYN